MRKNYILLFFGSIFMFFSCKISQPTQATNFQEGFQITSKESIYASIPIIEFLIENSNQNEIRIFRPYEIEIQKRNGKDWKKIRTLYCPCGASCSKPPEYGILKLIK